MKTSRNTIGRKKSTQSTKPVTPETPSQDKGWELPSGESLAEFAIHAGFVASLLMASTAVGTTTGEESPDRAMDSNHHQQQTSKDGRDTR